MEPVMAVETVTPEESIGDVIGDINSRRGKIHEINTRNRVTSIKSEVPLANMFGYATDLRSKTQGSATFSMQFKKYEPIPENIANEIIKKVKGAVAV